ncbi:hypothetical protein HPB50_026233 [Hyalomma asiaticum]|uniref:Uncharacterized protein n=1 Tax=Hyalomma asiaticum TaxID=266040 RepID=A0ACB7SRM0_HYAAI|nr:hypothetical protein HPB50_026233 [Hyalomma asiaticum]
MFCYRITDCYRRSRNPKNRGNPSTSPIAAKPKSPAHSSTNIRGIPDLVREKKADEDDGQAFYAGGSEHSGQQVIGPGRKADSNENFVAEMFKAAKRYGAIIKQPGKDDRSGQPAVVSGSSFSGAGHKLGDTTTGNETAPQVAQVKPQPSVSRVLKMWENGFNIDDGPLRAYDDASSQQFLEYIRQGEIPPELSQGADVDEVELVMEDRRHEQFVEPQRAKVVAFEGTGHRLGAVSPMLSRLLATTPPPEDAEANAKKAINLNEALPTTNIQIRLSDGSKLVARMNETSTVDDIRKYIVNARPEYQAVAFTLLTTFPRKELTDEKATLKEANLLNVVIVQNLT